MLLWPFSCMLAIQGLRCVSNLRAILELRGRKPLQLHLCPYYAHFVSCLILMLDDCRVDGAGRPLQASGGPPRHRAIMAAPLQTMEVAMGPLPGSMGHRPGSGDRHRHRRVSPPSPLSGSLLHLQLTCTLCGNLSSPRTQQESL